MFNACAGVAAPTGAVVHILIGGLQVGRLKGAQMVYALVVMNTPLEGKPSGNPLLYCFLSFCSFFQWETGICITYSTHTIFKVSRKKITFSP